MRQAVAALAVIAFELTSWTVVVTDEEYDQRFANSRGRRRLKSDFRLVAYPGKKELVMVFRDVREVDGKPVRDKEDRITRMFVQPFDTAVRRARDIHRDGLRFNIDNGRMMDPLTVIGYLQLEYQAGFECAAVRGQDGIRCGRSGSAHSPITPMCGRFRYCSA